jgi:pimeloyl-ACP methyl ester carboxylesterase
MMRKIYADSRIGQIHIRYTGANGKEIAAPIVCLHPTPYSGLFFETIAPYLSVDRQVIAPDYPGYGGSDAGSEQPSIREFADAMCDALRSMMDNPGFEGPFDLFGFHTGCLVATEMSLIDPDLVGHLVLVDVPYFKAEKRKELHAMTTVPPVFSAEVSCLEKSWERNVGSRWDTQPLGRSLEIFTEEMRAGEGVNRGFHAAFTYLCDEAFAAVSKPTLVIATNSSLLEASRASSALIPGCRLRECPEVEAPAMEVGAQVIAEAAIEFLENDLSHKKPGAS